MANEYKVRKIDELTRLSDTRGVEKYYRHQIRTRGGTILSVDISEEDFSLDKASPVLLKAAQNADAILKAGG